MSIHSYAGKSPQDLSSLNAAGSSFVMPAGRVGWVTCRIHTTFAVGNTQNIPSSIEDLTDFTGQCEILPGTTVNKLLGQGLVVYDQT